MKFRPHKGTFEYSMKEAVDLPPNKIDLFNHIAAIAGAVGDIYLGLIDEMDVHAYSFDSRNGWDTHIVTIRGVGVVGFTDQAVIE